MPKFHLLSPRGFKAGAAAAGIKSAPARGRGAPGVRFTGVGGGGFHDQQSRLRRGDGRRHHIAGGKLRGIVVNAGNANACTGRRGEIDARRMCDIAARAVGCEGSEILPSSTGIIGRHLPMDKIRSGITRAAKSLGDSLAHARRFSDAILTTDTRRKMAAARFAAGRESFIVAGVCKGSGMIGPRLAPHATMLAYLTTDARISPPLLRRILADAAEVSFNAVTVDDQTSTNDTAAVLASGLGATIASRRMIKSFAAAMKEVCQTLAYKIAEDGEGATKVVEITVRGAAAQADANLMARGIANSPLVKCAMNGNDPNWGRILVAAGLCGAAFDPDRAELSLQNTLVFRSGRPMPFNPSAVSRSLAAKKVVVDLNCRVGKSSATVWTCDLSKQYVTINADYHT